MDYWLQAYNDLYCYSYSCLARAEEVAFFVLGLNCLFRGFGNYNEVDLVIGSLYWDIVSFRAFVESLILSYLIWLSVGYAYNL
jgi:hypothetical protein